MVGIQIVSARIGRVSGHGLATNIRKHYPPWLLYLVVGLLLVANTINIAADVSAMGEALKLIVGGSAQIYSLEFGVMSLVLQVFIPYQRYVLFLKWLTMALLAYVATAFVIDVPWLQVTHDVVMPQLQWKPAYVTTVVAVFGTTISPYLSFWQASQEVEDELADPKANSLLRAPGQAAANLRRIKIDTCVGMGFSNLVAFFIVLTAAVTLNLHGGSDIQTSAQAASALRPVAGEFAFLLFSAGIIGTGLLAIPVLAGSSAYALAGAFKWKNSLERTPMQAKQFYGIITISTIVGIALGFTPVDPIRALYWSAVINGVISVPIMALMMRMAVRTDIMGQFVISKRLKLMGWMATLLMATAVCAMFLTM
jgi:Mn2+/Fe2+ NRAMP family transporter